MLLEMFCYKSDSVENANLRDGVDYLQDFLSLSSICADAGRAGYQLWRRILGQHSSKLPKQLQDQLNMEAETLAADALVFEDEPEHSKDELEELVKAAPPSSLPSDRLN